MSLSVFIFCLDELRTDGRHKTHGKHWVLQCSKFPVPCMCRGTSRKLHPPPPRIYTALEYGTMGSSWRSRASSAPRRTITVAQSIVLVNYRTFVDGGSLPPRSMLSSSSPLPVTSGSLMTKLTILREHCCFRGHCTCMIIRYIAVKKIPIHEPLLSANRNRYRI